MRILVTNDDGIDSIGLHVLARQTPNAGAIGVHHVYLEAVCCITI